MTKYCKYCGCKLGVIVVKGDFCGFRCRTKYRELQRKAEVQQCLK